MKKGSEKRNGGVPLLTRMIARNPKTVKTFFERRFVSHMKVRFEKGKAAKRPQGRSPPTSASRLGKRIPLVDFMITRFRTKRKGLFENFRRIFQKKSESLTNFMETADDGNMPKEPKTGILQRTGTWKDDDGNELARLARIARDDLPTREMTKMLERNWKR